jgi:starch phosphorylase
MVDKPAFQDLPKRINGLIDLSCNLWWSWNNDARELFRILDRPLWRASGHNPVRLLQQIPLHKLVAATQNPDFLKLYDSVMSSFQEGMTLPDPWLTEKYPAIADKTIAYFSLEFAIHNSLPLYAGGLGILAGDYCKEASDIGLPMVGVGFMYPEGYFHQHILEEGQQEEIYEQLNFNDSPIIQVLTAEGIPLKITVPLDSRMVGASVWMVQAGRTKLYLLDTNLEENSQHDRQLSARLYVSDWETRLQQEIFLGIGGVRMLRALNIAPAVWHANEGHTSFMMLERAREYIEKGMSFDEAVQKVKARTVFTTHTPVPAGHDTFSLDLMEKYFQHFWQSMGISKEQFLKLGITDLDTSKFNMTVLALRLADYKNGVSQLHGKVCRHMWQHLWPDLSEENVPITSITNGVHMPTWLARQTSHVFDKHLSSNWLEKQDEPELWQEVLNIPDEDLWSSFQTLKYALINEIKDKIRKRWSRNPLAPIQVLAMGALLDTEVLTLGFSRRFTGYKRGTLILSDLPRLKRLVNNDLRPVQIIFAGKAHPNDTEGKRFIQEIYNIAKDPELGGRIAFIEDYDMHMARYLIRGADVWVNTPLPLQEACGTSGMKASMNGVPHLSMLGGWWYEGYNGFNGWAIREGVENIYLPDSPEQDKKDADQLYTLLEEKIIPLYYERDIHSIPHNWIKFLKESIRSTAPLFSTRRMIKEYIQQMYIPASQFKQ